ncbi:MAG: ATP-binding protein [Planctomycetes bacterium]|nr:ATP-binding protein [Planctomycetota bacterium]
MLNGRRITKADIDALVAGGEREGQRLDYKSQFPGKGDDRTEFLRHIAGMANTTGGSIVLGVEEQQEGGKPSGLPDRICGLVETNLDDVVLRLSSMIDTNISPRIVPQPEILIVEGCADAPVVVVRVKRSATKPHMFSHRFYARQGPRTVPLEVEQVRVEFLEGDEVPRRMRAFRADRIADLSGGDRADLLEEAPNMVVHVLPVAAFSRDSTPRDVTAVVQKNVWPPGHRGGGFSCRMTFDGACTFSGSWGSAVSYMQVFRSGCVEFATSEICGSSGERNFPILRLKQAAELLVREVPRVLRDLGPEVVSYPLAIAVSLLGVKGSRATFSGYGESWTDPVQEDRALLPELVLEQPPEDWGRAFQATLDAMWHGVGCPKCTLYTNGEFQGRR